MSDKMIVCFEFREIHNSREKNCLEKLQNVISELHSKKHIVTMIPFYNKFKLKEKLINEYVFDEEQCNLLIKNSEVFFNNYQPYANILYYIPLLMKAYNISNKSNIIIVENSDNIVKAAIKVGHKAILVPHIGSPVYHKYLDYLMDLIN
jgi:hypothetical protein